MYIHIHSQSPLTSDTNTIDSLCLFCSLSPVNPYIYKIKYKLCQIKKNAMLRYKVPVLPGTRTPSPDAAQCVFANQPASKHPPVFMYKIYPHNQRLLMLRLHGSASHQAPFKNRMFRIHH